MKGYQVNTSLKAIVSHSDPEITEHIRSELIRADFDVTIKEDPSKVEKCLMNGEKNLYDVLIIGTLFEESDGLSITKRIRASACHIPVIFVSKEEDLINKINALGSFVQFVKYPILDTSFTRMVMDSISHAQMFVEIGKSKQILLSLPMVIEQSVQKAFNENFEANLKPALHPICSANTAKLKSEIMRDFGDLGLASESLKEDIIEVVQEDLLDVIQLTVTPSVLAKKAVESHLVKAIVFLAFIIVGGFHGLVLYNNDQVNETKKDVAVIQSQLTGIVRGNERIQMTVDSLITSSPRGVVTTE